MPNTPLKYLGPICIALIGLFVAGCAGPGAVTPPPAVVPEAFPHHSADQIQRFVANATRIPDSYESRASIRLDSPLQSGNFNALIRQKESDSLYATMSPGLGIEAARALVTADSFYVHDRIKRQLFFGPIENIGVIFPVPPSLAEFATNIVGSLQPDPNTAWDLEAEERTYILLSQNGREMFEIDPFLWRVTRYEQRDGNGTLIEERIFSEFELFDNLYVPRRVLFRRPQDEVSMALYHRSISLNVDGMSFELRVGRDVERVPVGPVISS